MKNSTDITMYSSAFCPFCRRALALFQHKGVNVQVISVDGAPAIRAEMTRLTGKTSVPQIWVGNTYVGGCDDLYALERLKQLDGLLGLDG